MGWYDREDAHASEDTKGEQHLSLLMFAVESCGSVCKGAAARPHIAVKAVPQALVPPDSGPGPCAPAGSTECVQKGVAVKVPVYVGQVDCYARWI